jgi:hypothetical protein
VHERVHRCWRRTVSVALIAHICASPLLRHSKLLSCFLTSHILFSSVMPVNATSLADTKQNADDRRNLYVLGLPFALTKWDQKCFLVAFPDYTI